MSIIASELKWYKSETVTEGDSNGGRMSMNEVVDGVKNNIFYDVSQADRLAGKIFYKKIFGKLENDADEVLINPVFHQKTYTPGQDWIEIFITANHQTDTQVDVEGTTGKFGVGPLTTDISAGVDTFDMTLSHPDQVIYEATGNCVYLGDGVNQEYHTNVNASKTGSTVTFTLQTVGDVIANNYDATTPETLVATCYYGTLTELKPTFETITTDSAAGTYDDTGNPVEGDNIGCREDTFTLTMTSSDASAATFTAEGALEGSIDGGTTGTDWQPTNTAESKPYFILRGAGWSGPFVIDETFTIPAHPAAQGVWLKQTVPSGCNSYSGDNFYVRFGGESA